MKRPSDAEVRDAAKTLNGAIAVSILKWKWARQLNKHVINAWGDELNNTWPMCGLCTRYGGIEHISSPDCSLCEIGNCVCPSSLHNEIVQFMESYTTGKASRHDGEILILRMINKLNEIKLESKSKGKS